MVSVLITVYNRERYIAAAIESVLAQTFANFELIIVDDGSRDSSVDVAQRYEVDKRVKVHRNPVNLGDYSNRNKAAAMASGKYLKYVDADDLIYPHCLEVMVEAMEKCPEAGLGISSSVAGIFSPAMLAPRSAYLYEYSGGGLLDAGPLGTIIRRAKFESAGRFDGARHTIDWRCWLGMARRDGVVIIPSGVYWWRRHDEQESRMETRNDCAFAEVAGRRFKLVMEALNAPDSPLDAQERRKFAKRWRQYCAQPVAGALLRKQMGLARKLVQEIGLKWREVLQATWVAPPPLGLDDVPSLLAGGSASGATGSAEAVSVRGEHLPESVSRSEAQGQIASPLTSPPPAREERECGFRPGKWGGDREIRPQNLEVQRSDEPANHPLSLRRLGEGDAPEESGPAIHEDATQATIDTEVPRRKIFVTDVPFISIIIPDHNDATHLDRAIRSIVSQQFGDWELIVADNASTDQTTRIAALLAGHPRFRVLRYESCLGQWEILNRSAALAHGKYLKFLAAEDVLYPHSLEHWAYFAQKFPQAAMIQSHEALQYLAPKLQSPREVYQEEYFGGVTVWEGPSGCLYRRDAWNSVGGFKVDCTSAHARLHLELARSDPILLVYGGLAGYGRGSRQLRHCQEGDFARSPADLAWLAELVRHPGCPLETSEIGEALENNRRLRLRWMLSRCLGRKNLVSRLACKSLGLSQNGTAERLASHFRNASFDVQLYPHLGSPAAEGTQNCSKR